MAWAQSPEALLSLLKALADETRLKLFIMMTKREYSAGELAAQVNLTEPTISHHLAKLREEGLLNLRTNGNQRFYSANPSTLARLKMLIGKIETLEPAARPSKEQQESWLDSLNVDADTRKILRECSAQGRLQQLPTKEKKLIPILEWMESMFQPDMQYTEKQVNDIIMRVYNDFATMRRLLVDYGYLRRERGGGAYWLAPKTEVQNAAYPEDK